MKCDLCNKEATIHYTQILNDQVTEIHLCENCAKKKDSFGSSQKFQVSDLLSSLTDFTQEEVRIDKEPPCPGCGLSFRQFKKIGRLGCAQCYDTFGDHLEKLLKRIHGSKQHLGKSPHKRGETAKQMATVQKLRINLEKAIQEEHYEQAAKIRDEIKKLETMGHESK